MPDSPGVLLLEQTALHFALWIVAETTGPRLEAEDLARTKRLKKQTDEMLKDGKQIVTILAKPKTESLPRGNSSFPSAVAKPANTGDVNVDGSRDHNG